jgi:hypothetical protein
MSSGLFQAFIRPPEFFVEPLDFPRLLELLPLWLDVELEGLRRLTIFDDKSKKSFDEKTKVFEE